MRKITFFLVFALIGMSLCSCQKAVFDDEEEGIGDGVKLQFHITQFEQVPLRMPRAERISEKYAPILILPFTKVVNA